MHRALVARIGLPDASFFLAADDLEYCLRAANAGARRILVAASRISHPLAQVYSLRLLGKTFYCLSLPPWKRYYDTRNRIFFRAPTLWLAFVHPDTPLHRAAFNRHPYGTNPVVVRGYAQLSPGLLMAWADELGDGMTFGVWSEGLWLGPWSNTLNMRLFLRGCRCVAIFGNSHCPQLAPDKQPLRNSLGVDEKILIRVFNSTRAATQYCTRRVKPPSTTRLAPVIKLAAGLATNTTALATSAGVPMRPMGFCASAAA